MVSVRMLKEDLSPLAKEDLSLQGGTRSLALRVEVKQPLCLFVRLFSLHILKILLSKGSCLSREGRARADVVLAGWGRSMGGNLSLPLELEDSVYNLK